MARIFANLYRFTDAPFRKGQKYSYLLVRKKGNLLLCHFKRGSSVTDHYEDIEALGGVDTQFITHSHEASAVHDEVYARLGCRLCYHEAERKKVRIKTKCPEVEFGGEGLQIGSDFEALCFPGDAPGTSICGDIAARIYCSRVMSFTWLTAIGKST